ncbi:G-protein coupled receptor 4-like isoform X2 [Perca fluviatilis]|uniref:G-protein coupled receptor 4-like isoform X2 n=1 Tax=Perca fluviatilis TaxID=8168 RepID=UPI0019669DBA|nr:G-protein coupled receptor 4-like isoform X2 [Perca fluviatilis]
MGEVYVNDTLQDMRDYYNSNFNDFEFKKILFIINVVTCIIISIGLPLTLVAIYALYSLVGKYNVAPIYVINLLISDLIQFCCLIGLVAKSEDQKITVVIYFSSLLASVYFMVCIALERYLVIACPLWYRFRRSIKSSVVVCVLVWVFPLIFFIGYVFCYC